jgi:hypothetical protein
MRAEGSTSTVRAAQSRGHNTLRAEHEGSLWEGLGAAAQMRAARLRMTLGPCLLRPGSSRAGEAMLMVKPVGGP